jgi:hypothetical protein
MSGKRAAYPDGTQIGRPEMQQAATKIARPNSAANKIACCAWEEKSVTFDALPIAAWIVSAFVRSTSTRLMRLRSSAVSSPKVAAVSSSSSDFCTLRTPVESTARPDLQKHAPESDSRSQQLKCGSLRFKRSHRISGLSISHSHFSLHRLD